MKGAFIISDVDLRNGEEHVDGKERGGCNEASFFFFLHLFLLSLSLPCLLLV